MGRVENFVTHTTHECLHLVIRLGQEQAFKAFRHEDAMSSIGMGSTISNISRYGAYPLLRQGLVVVLDPANRHAISYKVPVR